MSLPPAVAAGVSAALGAAVRSASGVGGGCVSPAWRADLADGRRVFVKTAPAGAGGDLLDQEAAALRALAAAGAVRVPAVLAMGGAWLALEWLEPGPATDAAWSDLGRGVAALHRSTADRWGWPADNYIGPLPQSNAWSANWPEFWAERRLRPQVERARDQLGVAARDGFERLLGELDGRLAAAAEDGPSLLHGDLWSGNVHMTAGGAALIDPSSSYGHREVDLAMADLFGGFAPPFWRAYESAWPLLPGAAARRPIYQLYYLLVHVNLFGAGYVAGTERALRAALAG